MACAVVVFDPDPLGGVGCGDGVYIQCIDTGHTICYYMGVGQVPPVHLVAGDGIQREGRRQDASCPVYRAFVP